MQWHERIPETRTLQLLDGRRTSYAILGDSAHSRALIWIHGIMSSRFEALAATDAVLNALNAFVVAVDRPGYGHSTAHKGRSYDSFVTVSIKLPCIFRDSLDG